MAILKLSIGLIYSSFSVLADGIDSASDIIVSIITLVTAKIVAKPPNPSYPYGFRRADAVAAKALSFVIFFAGAQLAISSFTRLSGESLESLPDKFTFGVTFFSIIGKLLLATYLLKLGKTYSSSMLKANGLNMRSDVMVSVFVLLGLLLGTFFNSSLPDAITAFLVSLWIMRTAFSIFMETNRELMDGVMDVGVYEIVFQAVSQVGRAHNPHRLRVRRIGDMRIIAIDIEVDPSKTVLEAHEIATEVESTIKSILPDVYDVLVHIEPLGNQQPDETFGVSSNLLKDIEKTRKN